MNKYHFPIKTKLVLLTLSISLIFIISSFAIKSSNNQVANNFNQFYNHTFSSTISFENIKSAQTNIMLNVRGLQISYLLGLPKQVDDYTAEINFSTSQTPILMTKLSDVFSGDIIQLNKLGQKISTFQQASQVFISTMQSREDNKAPYAIFAAFRDSYTDLDSQFDVLTQLNKAKADDSYFEASAAISKATWIFYVSIIVALLASTCIAVLFSNKMNRDINRVKNTAIDLSNGKLTTRSTVNSRDEIYLLSNALNTSIQNLHNALTAINQSTTVVSHNSQLLVDANMDIQNAATAVSDNTVQATTAIEQLTITSNDIAHNISDTAQTSHAMTTLANQGITSSAETKDAVIELVQNLDKTSSAVGKLRDESRKIESILDVIRSISEQTNLLALNAAIEAARAGEQGRGFAVVADEVRGLAQRSQSSVNEIEVMLAQLSTACDEAVQMMTTSTKIATSAEARVVTSNHILEDILKMIEQVNTQTQQIATAAEEQSSVVTEISTNMHIIQELSNKTAHISSDTLVSSNEMNQNCRQVLEQISFFTFR